jgi:hypothetical protein
MPGVQASVFLRDSAGVIIIEHPWGDDAVKETA